MFAWGLLTVLWGIFNLKTFFLLSSREQTPFLILIGSVVLLLILLSLLSRKGKSKEAQPQDQLSRLYFEALETHRRLLNKLKLYWSLMWGALLVGLSIFLSGKFFYPSTFRHPGVITLTFSLVCLFAILSLERGKLVDSSLIRITLKGIKTEKTLSKKGLRYFSRFINRRGGVLRAVYPFFRMLPILLIVFLLFNFGVFPILRTHLPPINFTQNIFLEIAPIVLTVVVLIKFVQAPYWKLVK